MNRNSQKRKITKDFLCFLINICTTTYGAFSQKTKMKQNKTKTQNLNQIQSESIYQVTKNYNRETC